MSAPVFTVMYTCCNAEEKKRAGSHEKYLNNDLSKGLFFYSASTWVPFCAAMLKVSPQTINWRPLAEDEAELDRGNLSTYLFERRIWWGLIEMYKSQTNLQTTLQLVAKQLYAGVRVDLSVSVCLQTLDYQCYDSTSYCSKNIFSSFTCGAWRRIQNKINTRTGIFSVLKKIAWERTQWSNSIGKRCSWTSGTPCVLTLSISLAKEQKNKYDTHYSKAFLQLQSGAIFCHFQTCSRSLIWTTFLNFQVLGQIFSRWELAQHEAPREHTQEGKVKKLHVYLYSSLFSTLHLMFLATD